MVHAGLSHTGRFIVSIDFRRSTDSTYTLIIFSKYTLFVLLLAIEVYIFSMQHCKLKYIIIFVLAMSWVHRPVISHSH